MATIQLLGFPNVIDSSVTIFPVGSEPAGFEASHLKNPEPSETARITSLDPLYTWWDITFPSFSGRDVYGITTVNSNLSPRGLYRYGVGASGYVAVNTTSLVSSSNALGAYTDVDEAVSSADGVYMRPSVTTTAWSGTYGFSSPIVTPATGTGNGVIVIKAILVGTVTDRYPIVSVDLFQSGVLVLSLGHRAVADSTANQIFIFDFDPSVLSGFTSVQAKVTFKPGSNGTYGKLDVVRCYYTPDTAGGLVKDSNWLRSSRYAYAGREQTVIPTQSFHHFPSDPWLESASLSMFIVDDQVDHDPDAGTTSSSGIPVDNVVNPIAVGYVEAGVWSAGGVLTFTPGLTVDAPGTVAVQIDDVSGYTLGGQSYGASSWRRRRTGQLSLVCTRTEADLFMHYVPWSKGHSSPFYLCMTPDIDIQYHEFQSFWAVLVGDVERTEVRGAYAPDGSALFTVTCQFEEKL